MSALWVLAWLIGSGPAALTGPAPTATTPGACAPVVLHDPRGDDDGPGTYRYPTGPGFSPGQFDLVAFELRPVGTDIELIATFASRLAVLETTNLAQDVRANVFLPQVDLYVDIDRHLGSGQQRVVPGRRVLLAPGSAWEAGVVLTALPDRVSDALRRADPDVAHALEIPGQVQIVGRTLRARVPAELFGGCPSPRWGYTVLVTAVTLSTSLKGLVTAADGREANVFTREITAGPGTCHVRTEAPDGSPCTFGGCAPCEGHPRVLDALIAADADQHTLLAAYGPDLFPVLPARVPEPDPGAARADAAPPSCPEAGDYAIADRRGDTLTVLLPGALAAAALPAGRIVDFLDDTRQPVGQGVTVRTAGRVLVLERVSGEAAGALRFVRIGCAAPPAEGRAPAP